MRAAGKVNLVALVLLAGAAGAIYWLIFFIPVYLDNIDVKNAVEAAYNRAASLDDVTIRGQIKAEASRFGTHIEDDGFGNMVEKQGLGLTDEQIVIERDEVLKTVLVRVDYAREVKLKPFG